MNDSEALTLLSARVTALTILVEALWAEELSKDADPAKMSQVIIDDLFDKHAVARKEIGESAYALQVSDLLTSLIDRAVTKAVLRRQT